MPTRRALFHHHVLFLFAALTPLGIAAAANPPDLAYLQNGVREIAPTYTSGSLVVFGEQAFPVVTGRSG
jgi:hypothetical protein